MRDYSNMPIMKWEDASRTMELNMHFVSLVLFCKQ